MVRTWMVGIVMMGAGALRAQDARAPLPTQIPMSFTPPAGLCRVWLDGVPASQQPAPTDCASAIKNRPAGAAVVFGPNAAKRRDDVNDLETFPRAMQSPIPASRMMASPYAPGVHRLDVRGDARGDARGETRGDPRDRAGERALERPAARGAERTVAEPVKPKPEKPY